MKLSEARRQSLQFLDDPDGQRWPFPTGPFDTNNEVDLAIQMAAQECVSQYAAMGGDFFDVVLDIAATGGTYSFASLYDSSGGGDAETRPFVPLMIRSVTLKEGNQYFNIYSIREQDIEVDSNINQEMKVRVIFTPDFTDLPYDKDLRYSTGITDPTGATADKVQIGWPLFDQWVCTVAAKHLTPKENETNTQLDERIMMLRDATIKSPETPLSVLFPRQNDRMVNPGALWFRWSYVTRDARADKAYTLRIHKVRFW